ncbi:MAG TPA: LuxR C-terminal-related transcriptional regulator [Chryseolinea sp.]
MVPTKRATEALVNFIQSSNETQDQYVRFESEMDGENVVASLKLLEQLFPDRALMLCNRSHPKLYYLSANCENVVGHTDRAFQNFSVNDFCSLLHPDDVRGVQQCFEFINGAEPYDPLTHRFILHYRFKGKDGKFSYLIDEKLAIKTENQKYIYFTMFRKASQDEKFHYVKLDIQQVSKGKLIKVYSYNPRQLDNVMTPRQHEIVKLIVRGFSNQEIAEQLNLSINTVKNHKQLLFKRINVKSSIELASYARGISGEEETESETVEHR